jgi:hypothetical protein
MGGLYIDSQMSLEAAKIVYQSVSRALRQHSFPTTMPIGWRFGGLGLEL